MAIPPSALDVAGPPSAAIGRLYWFLLALSVAVYAAVMLSILIAALRREKDAAAPDDRSLRQAVVGAVGVTVASVLAVLALSARTGSALAAVPPDTGISVRVTGHQWWWEVEYSSGAPQLRFETANEIHVPTGIPIHLTLISGDVIHSLWAPNLHGKRDLFPGRSTRLDWQVDREGVYRGMCAEFCGHQHAHMGLLVVAESPTAFEAWTAAQRKPAAAPAAEASLRGRELFLSAQCALCHTVRGTPAGGRAGPDLTHLASRQTLGAVTLPNAAAPLQDWIANPQTFKPGSRMPASSLGPAQIADVASYLQELH
jgi:cytochrome c oxidase subunit 2